MIEVCILNEALWSFNLTRLFILLPGRLQSCHPPLVPVLEQEDDMGSEPVDAHSVVGMTIYTN